ncbi:MAG: S41 family peptidase [Bacteroidales bacterium]|jgi:carboxyl-terminal processing protease|nr:S41 family peptidase [Bacteroidales bacterium]
MKNKKRFIIPLVLLTLLSSTLFWSFKEGDDFKIAKSLDIFYSLFRDVNTYYVDETNPEKLIETSINAMLESLDPYTVYIPESEMDEFTFMTTGQYGGIGALIRNKDGQPIIAQPYKDFPADKAGLKAGDIILEIDGVSTREFQIDNVSEKLKGIPQTKLSLLIERPYTNETFIKELIREEIKIKSVPYYGLVDKGIAYISVNKFTPDVSKEVKEALKKLKSTEQLTGLIIDLRGNPGGLLVEAPKICNLFMDKGQEIVSTKGKLKKWDQTYKTTDAPYDTEIPIVVLVNRGSASAAEIVAGAFQDLDRAVILGQRTFGKGLVQTTVPLNYNSQLKVTTAKYYIPSGRCIQARDYTHRNDDGSVGYVPDSLISEFTTKNGRKVYDGGGIIPDIKTTLDELSPLTITLVAENIVFDYVTKFVCENKAIKSAAEFEITDQIYNDFIDYALAQEFTYQTSSEKELAQLEKVLKGEKYFQRVESEINELRKKLANDKKKDILEFKEDIKEFLRDEIIGRYYYEEGQIQSSLVDDNQVFRAIEILNNNELYRSILNGTYKEPEAKLSYNFEGE